MSNPARCVEISWARALENPTALGWGRIADMLWGMSLYITYREMEAGPMADDFEDALELYEIANWRVGQCLKSNQ